MQFLPTIVDSILDPDNASAWNNKGAALYALERYDDAILAYDRGLDP